MLGTFGLSHLCHLIPSALLCPPWIEGQPLRTISHGLQALWLPSGFSQSQEGIRAQQEGYSIRLSPYQDVALAGAVIPDQGHMPQEDPSSHSHRLFRVLVPLPSLTALEVVPIPATTSPCWSPGEPPTLAGFPHHCHHCK